MALYPIYTNYHNGLGLEQYARHQGFLSGDVLFHNPWQYRVLSHWLIEGGYQVYTHTIDQVVDIEKFVPSNRLATRDHGQKERIYINFASDTVATPPWNNMTTAQASNLLNDQGEHSSISLALQTPWWKTHVEGPTTGDNSGVYPDDVLRDYYYFGIFGGPDTVKAMIQGLNPNTRYAFTFLAGSRWSGATDNGSTVFTSNSESKALPVQNNHSKVVTLDNITPNSAGEATFTMTKKENTPAGYLNAMVVESLGDQAISTSDTTHQDKYAKTQELLSDLSTPGFVKYNMIFILFRFLLHIMIFIVAFMYYTKMVKSDWLIFIGLIILSLSMGNSVNDSDLAFNTYIDVLLYLMAGYIIYTEKYDWYILPIAILGALNRETSVLIPFIYYVCRLDLKNFSLAHIRFDQVVAPKKTIMITAISYLFFIAIYFGLRFYYGFEDYQGVRGASPGLPTLVINLFSLVSIKTYFEMYGTFMILPLIFIYKFNSIDFKLRIIFLALVPIWFLVHWWSAVAYQSRLFLVPTLLVFIPGVLEVVEKSILQVSFKKSNQ